MRPAAHLGLLVATAVLGAACTYHPPGEREERARAAAAVGAFRTAPSCRATPALPPSAGPDELVCHALLASADVEVAYWEWRAAIERVPQAGTPDTTLAVFGSVGLEGEGSTWSRTTLGLQNDPMFNLPPPSRIAARARRALEEARAAGARFEQTKWDVRRRVLDAYYDYALLHELVRVAGLDVDQWELTVTSTEGRVEAGAVGQHGLLVARNALDLSRSEVATLRSRLPAKRAALNALLSRPAAAAVPVPASLPAAAPLSVGDDEMLRLAAQSNPELRVLALDASARAAAIREARTAYLPEVSLSGSVTGDVARTIGGMITLPFVRGEALRAAVEEARHELRAAEARRRRASNDLVASVVLDLATIHDLDRRIALFEGTLVPRSEQAVELVRTGYTVDRSTYLEIQDAQRTLIDSRRTLAELRVERARTLVDLEAKVGKVLPSTASREPAGAQPTTASAAPSR